MLPQVNDKLITSDDLSLIQRGYANWGSVSSKDPKFFTSLQRQHKNVLITPGIPRQTTFEAMLIPSAIIISLNLYHINQIVISSFFVPFKLTSELVF